MGQCLRGKMVEVGLIPAPPATAVAETEAPAEEVVASVEEAAVPAEPELDVTPPVETEADAEVDQVVAATFGLLRAEPDGSVVIAGSGTPGSRVEVFANGELLGTVEVESSGDWVFVPDVPLAPGGLEITLGEEGKPGTAEDSFIVVIDEDKTSQPLVVASTPGEASEVLQGLTEPVQLAQAPDTADDPVAAEASSSEAVAEPLDTNEAVDASEPAAANAPATAPESTGNGATAEAEPSGSQPVEPQPTETPERAADAPATEPAADEPTEEPAQSVAALPEAIASEAPQTSTIEAPSATPEAAATQDAPANVDATDPASAVASTESPTADAEASTDVAASTSDNPVAVTDEPVVQDAPIGELASQQPDVVPPTIDAIEIENNRTFFAGAGPDGGTIRLYVDDSFVADTTVEGGRWLVEAGPVLDDPSQRVRVDLLQPGSADVVARAEVDFVVDVPSAETPIDVAEAPAPAAAPTDSDPVQSPEPAASTATAPATPETGAPEQPAPAQAAPETDEATAEAAQAEPVGTPDPVVTDPEPPTEAPDQQVAQVDPVPTEPATGQSADQAPAAEQPQQELAEPVEAPAEAVSDEPAVPTMVAVSLGDPDAQRFASGRAIIRRGDNLWTIARRVYGEGLKYTTIYQANTGQIRDPDRIYPGQVFDLPEDALTQ